MEAVYLALIAASAGILSPLLLSWIQSLQKRKDKKQEYDRLDAVANQAAEAARLLVEFNAKVAASSKVTDQKLDITDHKLDVIHGLVNSNMTTALQSELAARSESLILMLEMAELKRAGGRAPMPEALAAIAVTKARIAELKSALEEREKQNALPQTEREVP